MSSNNKTIRTHWTFLYDKMFVSEVTHIGLKNLQQYYFDVLHQAENVSID